MLAPLAISMLVCLSVRADDSLKLEEQALIREEKQILAALGAPFQDDAVRASLGIPAKKVPEPEMPRSQVTGFIDSMLREAEISRAQVAQEQFNSSFDKQQSLAKKEARFANDLAQTQDDFVSLTHQVDTVYERSLEALSGVHDVGTRSLLLRSVVSELSAVADVQVGETLEKPQSQQIASKGWRQGERYSRYKFPSYALNVALPVRGRRNSASEDLTVENCGTPSTPCAFVASGSEVRLRLEPDGEVRGAEPLEEGEPLRIDYRSGDWYRVKTTNGSLGWVNTDDLIFGPDYQLRPTEYVKVRGVQAHPGERGPL
ncbi:MAG: hypothetical protein KDD64_12035 [Bdellovibrionales bacterium]|nr:hypothetical protein [Bdellovibrionales bacterium]